MLRRRFQHELVHIAVESIIREIGKVTNAVEIIILSVRVGSQGLEIISRVPEAQNAGAAGM